MNDMPDIEELNEKPSIEDIRAQQEVGPARPRRPFETRAPLSHEQRVRLHIFGNPNPEEAEFHPFLGASASDTYRRCQMALAALNELSDRGNDSQGPEFTADGWRGFAWMMYCLERSLAYQNRLIDRYNDSIRDEDQDASG